MKRKSPLLAALLSLSLILSTPVIANAASWESDSSGWWYQDGSWYPLAQWYEIDGIWYYFDASGYMEYSCYRDGYWLNSDGSCNTSYKGGYWASDSTGWWFTDESGWYPVSQWLKIDGYWYYFKADGYMATDEWIDDCYLNSNGAWEPGKEKTADTPSGTGNDQNNNSDNNQTDNSSNNGHDDNSNNNSQNNNSSNNSQNNNTDSNSSSHTSAYIENGKIYDKDGKIVRNKNVILGYYIYHVDSEGYYTLITNSIAEVDGKNYYVNSEGYITKGINIIYNDKIYNLGEDSVATLVTDSIVNVDGNNYYADSTGSIVKNKEVSVNEKKYQADANGVLTEVEVRSIPKKWDDDKTYKMMSPYFVCKSKYKAVYHDPNNNTDVTLETTNYIYCSYCDKEYDDLDDYLANDRCCVYEFTGKELNRIIQGEDGKDCLYGDYLLQYYCKYIIYTTEFNSGGIYYENFKDLRIAGCFNYSEQRNPNKTITTKVYAFILDDNNNIPNYNTNKAPKTIYIENGKMYDKNGNLMPNTRTTINSNIYITDSSGNIIKNSNVIYSPYIFSTDSSGAATKNINAIITIDGKSYYVDSNGLIEKNRTVTFAGKTYQADYYGVLTEITE